jgi:hypothetical protein
LRAREHQAIGRAAGATAATAATATAATVTGESFKSFGFEVMSDFHLFRSPFLISAGVQSAWKDTTAPPVFEFLLNIDIFGMTIGR